MTKGANMLETYVLEGVTSEGDAFDFPGVRFDTFEQAMAYATEYARGVTDTTEVYADHASGWVRAAGTDYSETLRIREIG